jgi:hypothetical protein
MTLLKVHHKYKLNGYDTKVLYTTAWGKGWGEKKVKEYQFKTSIRA